MSFCTGKPPADADALAQKLRKTQKPCLVTGATGFVASHLVEQLLADGNVVRGTVRDLKNTEKHQHLLNMKNAALLDLVEGDVLDEKAMGKAVAGCDRVYHVASPFKFDAKDPQTELVDVAVNGTLNVLRACAEHKVEKVVLTSSIAAVAEGGSGKTVSEEDWNNTSSLKRLPYLYSKTMAERAAWDFVKELPEDGKFKLVTILPSLVLGPSHLPTLNESHRSLTEFASGKVPAIPKLTFNYVDVRDVAKAHMLAMASEEAEGRYLCTNERMVMKDVIDILRTDFPNFKWPMKMQVPNLVVKVGTLFQPKDTAQFIRSNTGKPLKVDNSKIQKELKMEFMPIEQSLKDTFEDLVARGHVAPKKKAAAPAEETEAAQAEDAKAEDAKAEESKDEKRKSTKAEEAKPEEAKPEEPKEEESKAEKRKSKRKSTKQEPVKEEAKEEAKPEEAEASESKDEKRKSTKADKRKSTKAEEAKPEEAKPEEAKEEESKAEKRKSKRKSTKQEPVKEEAKEEETKA